MSIENYVRLDTYDRNGPALQQISLESISNPFRGITESIKSNMHQIVENLNFVKPTGRTTSVNDNYVAYKNAASKVSRESKSLNFIDIKNIKVVVPTGFEGNYVDYSKMLLTHMARFENLDRQVIKPAHDLILKYIGRPESLMSVDTQDFNKILLNTSANESFKKEMNGYFNMKRQHQSQPISILVNSIRQHNELFEQLNEYVRPWMLNDSWYSSVNRSYQEFQKSVELLMVRIEQKPDVYRLNKLSAERLANLIHDVALELELGSAMFTYLDQMMVCIFRLSDVMFKSLAEK